MKKLACLTNDELIDRIAGHLVALHKDRFQFDKAHEQDDVAALVASGTRIRKRFNALSLARVEAEYREIPSLPWEERDRHETIALWMMQVDADDARSKGLRTWVPSLDHAISHAHWGAVLERLW